MGLVRGAAPRVVLIRLVITGAPLYLYVPRALHRTVRRAVTAPLSPSALQPRSPVAPPPAEPTLRGSLSQSDHFYLSLRESQILGNETLIIV
ncbi:hypothetical protein E2C01_078344 [Portunus trituberculatus]|uniref:Uncharacterized protein n=1 Tax=Portunus trituberculatus TaxID=210409 RepID=A0A5B7IGS0_PORTR|nr:hypothetical protein [Portunus trituberculatus]